MTSLLALLPAVAAGWFLVTALRKPSGESAMARRVFDAAVALPLGLGACSTLFFVMVWAGVGPRIAAFTSNGLLLACGAALWWFKGRHVATDFAGEAKFKWKWVGWCALALGGAFFAGSIFQVARALPHGDWDAWATWNLRAKFLASDGAWTGAVSKELQGRTHPSYPLLWPGVVAEAWSLSGEMDPAAPAGVAGAMAVGLVALLLAGVWVLRGQALGLLSALVLLTTASLWHQAVVQYADIPLALFMLAALCCAMIAEKSGWAPATLALSGVLASMAAWTKDEGLIFCIALGATLVVVCRTRAAPWVAGAAPVLVAVAAFKLLLAPSAAPYNTAHLANFGRLMAIAGQFAAEVFSAGRFPGHPVLAAAACVFLLGFRRPLLHLWAAVPVAALFAGYVAAFWMTSHELTWHLQTSAGRLVLQIIPSMLLLLFVVLKAPADAATTDGKKRR